MSILSKPSILFVSHKYPPSTGGMEKQSFELIKGLESEIYVHKIVYDGSEHILKFFCKLNRRILACLSKHPEIALIHFNDGMIASMALSHKGYDHLKKVVTIHGLDVVFPWGYFQKRIIPKFKRFDLIIAVSQATADAVVQRGVAADKVKVIRNGVDHRLGQPAENITDLRKKYNVPLDKQLLIMLGRPVKRKGFSWFVEHILPNLDEQYYLVMIGPFNRKKAMAERIFSLLPSRIRHLVMLFLGYPSDEKYLRRLLSDEAYNARCVHLGKLPLAELRSFLSEATAFLMPNIQVQGDMEGFGLVCLEASLSGTLVVASELEGITDAIVGDKNGLLLPSQNQDAWIKQLNDISEHTESYKNLARKFALYSRDNYSWKLMCEEYLQAFSRLSASGQIS